MENTPNNLRVALYCRVSTEEQREGQTIESQVAELERFAHEKGWIVTGIYKDEGWSGTLLARPELDRLRDDASRGLFDAVLINDVDRLARDVTHLGVIKRDLERRPVRVIFKKLPGEQSPTHNLLVNILGSFAEFEREMIADRTRRGRRHKVEVRQQFLGSIPPFGFRYVPRNVSGSANGILEILPDEAAIVRQIYRWVDEEGISGRKVVQRLNQSGLRPRKKGRDWQKSSVRRILRSEVYAGIWHYNKHQLCEPRKRVRDQRYRKSARTSTRLRPRADWLPVVLPEQLRIIHPSQWQRVQEQLNRNISFSRRNAKHGYLLTGLVRCGGCQAAYVGDPHHGRFAYRCSKRCRKYGAIVESSLNMTVWNAVAEAFQNPDVIAEAVAAANQPSDARSRLESEDDEIARGLEQIEAEESRVLHAYRLEILSPEQLAQELLTLRARRTVLQSRKSTLNQEIQPKDTLVRRSLEDYCQEVGRKLPTLDWEKRQRLLRLLVKFIVFEGDQVRIRGVIPLADDSGSTVAPADAGIPGAGQIASTGSYHCARNVAEREQVADDGPRHHGELLFELVRKVEKDISAARDARRANLIKANAARKRGRSVSARTVEPKAENSI